MLRVKALWSVAVNGLSLVATTPNPGRFKVRISARHFAPSLK